MGDIKTASTDPNVASISSERAIRLAMAADIVSAYVTKNSVPTSKLPTFIASIYAGLGAVGEPAKPVEEPRKEPAVSIKKSITPDYLICLEDGTKFKTLKRHLISV